jgi:hypothetical protein
MYESGIRGGPRRPGQAMLRDPGCGPGLTMRSRWSWAGSFRREVRVRARACADGMQQLFTPARWDAGRPRCVTRDSFQLVCSTSASTHSSSQAGFATRKNCQRPAVI